MVKGAEVQPTTTVGATAGAILWDIAAVPFRAGGPAMRKLLAFGHRSLARRRVAFAAIVGYGIGTLLYLVFATLPAISYVVALVLTCPVSIPVGIVRTVDRRSADRSRTPRRAGD